MSTERPAKALKVYRFEHDEGGMRLDVAALEMLEAIDSFIVAAGWRFVCSDVAPSGTRRGAATGTAIPLPGSALHGLPHGEAVQLLKRIHRILNGKEWDAGTIELVAEVVSEWASIDEPDDEPGDEPESEE